MGARLPALPTGLLVFVLLPGLFFTCRPCADLFSCLLVLLSVLIFACLTSVSSTQVLALFSHNLIYIYPVNPCLTKGDARNRHTF